MNLHRFDYEVIDGEMVRVKREEIYVWAPMNIHTGEVELEDIRMFDDDLKRSLYDGWEWRRFTMTLSEASG